MSEDFEKLDRMWKYRNVYYSRRNSWNPYLKAAKAIARYSEGPPFVIRDSHLRWQWIHIGDRKPKRAWP